MWYHAKHVSYSNELLMDIVFSLQGVVFEWDDEKAQLNRAQHGVTSKKPRKSSSTRSTSTVTQRQPECKNNEALSWATPLRYVSC